jgi:hypothetical protein
MDDRSIDFACKNMDGRERLGCHARKIPRHSLIYIELREQRESAQVVNHREDPSD